MKIALPKNEENINQHFGKSKSFALITVDDNKIVEIKELNTESLLHNHGGLASLLKDQGVDVVITGGIGQGAIDGLKEKELSVVRGASGKIEDVVDSYIKGDLKDKNVVCSHHHDDHHHGEHHTATIKMPPTK